jgi:hypothetical protein
MTLKTQAIKELKAEIAAIATIRDGGTVNGISLGFTGIDLDYCRQAIAARYETISEIRNS